MKRIYLSLIFFVVGISLIIFGLKTSSALKDEILNLTYNSLIASNSIPDKIVKINLSFIGDSLLASFKGEKHSMNFQDLLDNNDYKFPYKNVSNIFFEDDFTIANGENVFTDRNLEPIEKDHSPAYWYYSKKRFANIYKESGIEVVSVMNNHSYDYGVAGYNDTIDALKEASVIPGDESDIILEKNGVKIGLICTNLFHSFQANETVNRIKNLKEKVDYVIIYFHGGTEYLYKPTNEIIEYSHMFIDNGADLVIGCHPHVLEPIEIYKDKTIVYSLGSFLFGGSLNFVNRTIIYQKNIEFNLTKDTISESSNIIPCYLYSKGEGYSKWIPDIIEDLEEKQRVIDFMNGLRDFPY